MLTTIQREAIVHEAKSWQGTPYIGHARIKGAGTDCGQILYAVYRACGLLPDVELPKDYSLQVAQHRASTEYVDFIARYFREIPESDVLPGDLVVYKLGHAYAHAAVVVSWPEYVIQAEMRHGVSGAHGTKHPAFKRAPRVFFTLKARYAVFGGSNPCL
jgi:cell wall-associated NlpC family hydrolase